MDGLGVAIQLPERKNKMAQQHNTLNACDYSIRVSWESSIKHRASSIKLEWWSLMAQKQEECPAQLHAAWVALGLPPARWACTQHLEMSFFFVNIKNISKGHRRVTIWACAAACSLVATWAPSHTLGLLLLPFEAGPNSHTHAHVEFTSKWTSKWTEITLGPHDSPKNIYTHAQKNTGTHSGLTLDLACFGRGGGPGTGAEALSWPWAMSHEPLSMNCSLIQYSIQ